MSEQSNDPPPSPPFVVCLHCGRQWEPGTRVCPQCGSIVLTGSEWPPPAEGNTPNAGRWLDSVERKKDGVPLGISFGCLGLAIAWGTTGLLAGWLSTRIPRLEGSFTGSIAADVLPLIAFGALYFWLRKKYPGVARGIGCVTVIAEAVALGLLTLCSQTDIPFWSHP